ncbi:MAG: hypothetical protein KC983_02830, partial [Phycisphaerales bacterium]|nr:hypothetical protein [Phycisphaerales bacterium]
MDAPRPTFHESWHRVADLKPRLRTTLQTTRQHFRGQLFHVVRDPTSQQHFRLNVPAYEFIARLDGRRRVQDVWHICLDELGDAAPTQGEVIQLLSQLHQSNLLQSDHPPDAEQVFEHYRQRRQREVTSYIMNILFMRIPLFDPDRFLSRWERVFGLAFTRTAFILWCVLLMIGGTAIIGRWGDVRADVSSVLAPDNLVWLYVGFAIVKVIHEFGHGFAAKHFGRRAGGDGEVHIMGLMLLVLMPIPYVDASSAWQLRSKWQRAFVGAAGMYVELAVASVAAVVWANTSPGLLHALAYNIMFVASVSTLLFNANP